MICVDGKQKAGLIRKKSLRLPLHREQYNFSYDRRMATVWAMTGKGDNDTPVQS